MLDVKVVLDDGHYFEGPRWHDGRLWVSDFFGHKVYSTDLADDVRVEAQVPNRPSGLGWLPDGRLLISSMNDQKVLRREADGELSVHADLTELAGGHQINDMIVDDRGHAYVGSMGFNPYVGDLIGPAPLLHVAPDGTASVASTDMWMPNGMALLPGPVLLVGENLGNCHTAFDIEDDGTLTNRRVWASYGPRTTATDVMGAIMTTDVGTDGCAADAECGLWVADAFHGRLIRVKDGEIVQQIPASELGVQGVFAVALGGADGRTLFVCTAPDFDPAARSAANESKVVAFEVDVPGIDFR